MGRMLVLFVPFLSVQSQGGEYGNAQYQWQQGKWQSEFQADRRRHVVEHLSAGNMRLHPDDDRFVSGSQLFEEVRQCSKDQRTIGAGYESSIQHDGIGT